MSDPASLEEYNARFARHHLMSGTGFETTVHMPCPFCAAPDWLVFRVLDTAKAGAEGATCKECGRSLRIITEHQPGGSVARFRQTGGPDPPAWCKIRRDT